MRNPLLSGCFPDPSAVQVGQTTYVVSSSFTWLPGLPIHRSDDLENWELCGYALTKSGELGLEIAKDSEGIFAPTLRYIDGRFVLVCTTVVGDTQRSFFVTAPHAEGPWTDPVFLEEAGGIDPDIFVDEDGACWWTGTRLAENPLWPQQTEIWTRPVDLETGQFTGEETILWHGAVEGAVWAEGPHLYHRNGWYYLLTAEGGTAEDHSVSIARSRSVQGPWEGSKRNPIFSHRTLGLHADIRNVGHADLFQRPDGSWWAVLLGVRPCGDHHLLGRETFLVPVIWEGDWPVFAPGLGRIADVVDTAPATPAGKRGLSAESSYPIAPRETVLSVVDFVAAAARPLGAQWSDIHASSFYGVRAASWNASISLPATTLSATLPALGIVHNATRWARIEKVGETGFQVVTSNEGDVVTYPLPPASLGAHLWVGLDDLTLRIGVGDKPGMGASYSFDASWLSTESAGGFTGCLLGVWTADSEATTAQIVTTGAHICTPPDSPAGPAACIHP